MLLQSGTAFLLQTKMGLITKPARYYKLGRPLLQIQSGPGITNWDECYYKVGQVLQTGTIITKWALTPSIVFF